MYRHIIFTIVASLIFVSCNKAQKTADDQWSNVYKNASKNQDFVTAIVALNHLILTDTQNVKEYYDTLAFYYLKKTRNFYAGELMVDKGLALSSNNPQLLEYKSIFLSSKGKLEESRSMLLKAYEISKLNKHRYMYATTFATEGKIEEYSKIVNQILYDKNLKPEIIDVVIDENNSQMIDIKAKIYLDKFQITIESAKTPQQQQHAVSFLDSSLKISPDYQEALYFKKKIYEK